MIDLHTHSIYSDGTETPSELVKRAYKARLTAFAIADHDSVEGQREAMDVAKELRVNLMSAVELTVDFHGGHIHILGYGFDIADSELERALAKRREERIVQFREKIALANKRLTKAGKGSLNADELLATINGSPGRPHIARAIVAKGWERTFRRAFDAYLLDYVPQTPAFSASPTISLIHNAGGITSLAHPGSSEIGLRRFVKDEQEERIALEELKKEGLNAVEAYTPAHLIKPPHPLLTKEGSRGRPGGLSQQEVSLIEYYVNLANELNLKITGGTDYHGPSFDAPAPGNFEIPDALLDQLSKVLSK